MPGLIRGIARTAVVAGTATAVSNRVSRRQAGRWARQEQVYGQEEYAPPEGAEQPVTAPTDAMDATIAQLKELADLKAQGVLTEAEFDAQKARILGA
jgi:hypothetical protein